MKFPIPGPALLAKLKLYGIIAMALVIAVGAAYGLGRWQGGNAAKDHIYAKQAGEDAAAQKRQDEVLGLVAAAIAKQRPINRNIYNQATEQVRTNTIYSECKLPPEMQELIRQSQQVAP